MIKYFLQHRIKYRQIMRKIRLKKKRDYASIYDYYKMYFWG